MYDVPIYMYDYSLQLEICEKIEKSNIIYDKVNTIYTLINYSESPDIMVLI